MTIDRGYHRRQASTLIRLAQTTRDPSTSAALMRLASEHIERAETEEKNEPEPDDAA